MQHKFLTIDEVASYLQLSRETLYKYVQRGVIPAVKIGRHWRFDKPALDAFIAAQTRKPRSTVRMPAPAKSPWTADPKSKKKLRVLLVDDDAAILKLLSVWIRTEGHQVDTAINGNLAMEQLARATYDMLFLDLHMPDITGGQVLGRLEEYPVRPPVVLITGYSETPLMEQAMEYDLLYVLSKPFHRKQVTKLLASTQAGNFQPSSAGRIYTRIDFPNSGTT